MSRHQIQWFHTKQRSKIRQRNVFKRECLVGKEIICNQSLNFEQFFDGLSKYIKNKCRNVQNKVKQADKENKRDEQKKLNELMNVPTIKLAYNALEAANKKLLATAEKLEKLGKNGDSRLDMFLQKTQNEIEMNELKAEYNAVARECLVQLTKFRTNIQSWTAKHPQYAKVANFAFKGVYYSALIVSATGILTSVVVSAPISIPATIAGTTIVAGKEYLLHKYLIDTITEYAIKQGVSFREKQEFKETIKWFFDSCEFFTGIKNLSKVAKDPIGTLKPKFVKTYTHIDKYGELARILRSASRAYSKTQKERLFSSVLEIL